MALVLEDQDLVVEESIADNSKVGICIESSAIAREGARIGILTDEVTD